jgi:hypothetical protein
MRARARAPLSLLLSFFFIALSTNLINPFTSGSLANISRVAARSIFGMKFQKTPLIRERRATRISPKCHFAWRHVATRLSQIIEPRLITRLRFSTSRIASLFLRPSYFHCARAPAINSPTASDPTDRRGFLCSRNLAF